MTLNSISRRPPAPALTFHSRCHHPRLSWPWYTYILSIQVRLLMTLPSYPAWLDRTITNIQNLSQTICWMNQSSKNTHKLSTLSIWSAVWHGPSQNQKSPIVRWQHLRLQFAFLKSGLVRYNLQILKSPLSVQFYEIWNNPNQSISIIPPKLPYSLLHPFNHWSARFYLHPTVHSFLMLKRMSPCGSAVYPLSSQKTLVLFPVFVS